MDVDVEGTFELAELEAWLRLRSEGSPTLNSVERKKALAGFEGNL